MFIVIQIIFDGCGLTPLPHHPVKAGLSDYLPRQITSYVYIGHEHLYANIWTDIFAFLILEFDFNR